MGGTADEAQDRLIILGRVSGLFGVRGWVKVHSYTDPPDNIVGYRPWLVHCHGEWRTMTLQDGRPHGRAIIAHLAGIDERDRAASLIGCDIAVRRSQLPPPQAGEYYWVDLEGLRVETTDGVDLGRVDHLLETGANDVLVVHGERERLIPFVEPDVVTSVDFDTGLIRVAWDPDF
jgi:16S rRNA processing protein RimM